MSQQLILKQQQLTVSEILRIYGKKFKQVRKRYSDGHNGRCAIGVLMSYNGWNGKDDYKARKKLMETLNELKQAGISKNLVLQLNDAGRPFDKIANYIDTVDNNRC